MMETETASEQTAKKVICCLGIRFRANMLEQLLRYDDSTEEWVKVPTVDLRKRFDWTGVDWTKPNNVIATELNTWPQYVAMRRRLLSIPKTKRKSKYADYPWAEFDWSKSNNQLAREIGVDIPIVSRFRHSLQKPPSTAKAYRSIVTEAMISQADWAWERDVDLANKWHVSRERVRQLRQQRKLPQCKSRNLSITGCLLVKWLYDHKTEIAGQPANEVMAAMPKASRPLKMKILRTYASVDWAFANSRQPLFSKMNWQLPNLILALIWGLKAHNIANGRKNQRHGKAKWFLGGFSTFPSDLAKVAWDEVAKAKKHGIDSSKKLRKYLASKT